MKVELAFAKTKQSVEIDDKNIFINQYNKKRMINHPYFKL